MFPKHYSIFIVRIRELLALGASIMVKKNWKWGWLIVLVIGLLIGVNLYAAQSPIHKEKISVIMKPGDKTAHLSLAKKAAELGDYKLAEEELKLALQLEGKSELNNDEVLGTKIETGEGENLRREIFPLEKVEAEISELEQELASKPGYRDILLKLAVLYWQVFKEDKAKEYYEQALELDPNDEMVQAVGKLLEISN